MITVEDEIKELKRQIVLLEKLRELYPDAQKGSNLAGNYIHYTSSINPLIDNIIFTNSRVGHKTYWYATMSKVVLENQLLYADPDRISLGYFWEEWKISGYQKRFNMNNYYHSLKENNFPEVLGAVIDKRLAKEILAEKASVENPHGSIVKYISIM